MVVAASLELRRANSMLDWPEQIQTSPKRTFLKVMVDGPEMESSYGPPSLMGSSLICHLPFASAVPCLVWSAILRVMAVLGVAVPQMGVAKFRWRTMLSEKMAGSFRSSARRVGVRNRIERSSVDRRRML